MDFITTSEERWLNQGIDQGIDQGISIGERSMLLRQLQRKFGTIPEHYRNKIEQANAESLLAWGDRVLECQNLQAIFES